MPGSGPIARLACTHPMKAGLLRVQHLGRQSPDTGETRSLAGGKGSATKVALHETIQYLVARSGRTRERAECWPAIPGLDSPRCRLGTAAVNGTHCPFLDLCTILIVLNLKL